MVIIILIFTIICCRKYIKRRKEQKTKKNTFRTNSRLDVIIVEQFKTNNDFLYWIIISFTHHNKFHSNLSSFWLKLMYIEKYSNYYLLKCIKFITHLIANFCPAPMPPKGGKKPKEPAMLPEQEHQQISAQMMSMEKLILERSL